VSSSSAAVSSSAPLSSSSEPTVNKIIEGDTVCERLVDGMAEFENYYALTGDTNATRGIEIFHQFFENADCPV
jgi:hypothetical protein